MNSLIALLALLVVSVIAEEYKFDENAEILYTYDQDGVKIEVLKKGMCSLSNSFSNFNLCFYGTEINHLLTFL